MRIHNYRHPYHFVAILALLLFSLALTSFSAHSAEQEFRIVVITEELEDPWAIAALPNGDILVSEKMGRLRIIRDGKLQEEPVEGVPVVRAAGQGGLQDLVLAPDFETSRLVYMTIAKPGPDNTTGTAALVRARFDGTRLTDLEEIIEAQAWGEAEGHYGTRLSFDDSGHLYFSVADRSSFYLTGRDIMEHPAHQLDTHMGKILRLNLDGSIPADNPFVNQPGALPEIWSIGHRDPQALAFRPETGDTWLAEHGPLGGDELNLLLAGRNFGWPVVSKGANYLDVTGFQSVKSRDDMEEPVYYWETSIAPSNITFYSGKLFPQWQGDALISTLAGQKLIRVSFNGNEVTNVATIVNGLGRIRDVHEGPNGAIYLAITLGPGTKTPIIRLEPVN